MQPFQFLLTLTCDYSQDGCEICKPAVGSILASIYNGVIIDDTRDQLQDTNDRSMANMQRGGTYSVVPRVPGGEITPEQLIQVFFPMLRPLPCYPDLIHSHI